MFRILVRAELVVQAGADDGELGLALTSEVAAGQDDARAGRVDEVAGRGGTEGAVQAVPRSRFHVETFDLQRDGRGLGRSSGRNRSAGRTRYHRQRSSGAEVSEEPFGRPKSEPPPEP